MCGRLVPVAAAGGRRDARGGVRLEEELMLLHRGREDERDAH
jgi:hypothetical protein